MDVPTTDKVPERANDCADMLLTVRAVMVVVARVEVPYTANSPVLVVEAKVTKLAEKAVADVVANVVVPYTSINPVLVVLAIVRSDMLVVAKAVRPCTLKLPVLVVDPKVESLATNLVAEVVANVVVANVAELVEVTSPYIVTPPIVAISLVSPLAFTSDVGSTTVMSPDMAVWNSQL